MIDWHQKSTFLFIPHGSWSANNEYITLMNVMSLWGVCLGTFLRQELLRNCHYYCSSTTNDDLWLICIHHVCFMEVFRRGFQNHKTKTTKEITLFFCNTVVKTFNIILQNFQFISFMKLKPFRINDLITGIIRSFSFRNTTNVKRQLFLLNQVFLKCNAMFE